MQLFTRDTFSARRFCPRFQNHREQLPRRRLSVLHKSDPSSRQELVKNPAIPGLRRNSFAENRGSSGKSRFGHLPRPALLQFIVDHASVLDGPDAKGLPGEGATRGEVVETPDESPSED